MKPRLILNQLFNHTLKGGSHNIGSNPRKG